MKYIRTKDRINDLSRYKLIETSAGMRKYMYILNGGHIWYREDEIIKEADTIEELWDEFESNLNGKVVARFWCGKAEEIYNDSDEHYECYYQTDTLAMEDLCEQSCLDYNELNDYLCEEQGKAIHITKLEIFNEPKEISDFHWYRKQWVDCGIDCPPYVDEVKHTLARAPQSWCYIEGD